MPPPLHVFDSLVGPFVAW